MGQASRGSEGWGDDGWSGRFSGIYFKAPRKEPSIRRSRSGTTRMRYATARLKKERSEYLKARQSFI